jgi:hypothetical protein
MDSPYGLGKPENRVAVPVGAEIFLLTRSFSPFHPVCSPMVQVSAIKRQGVIRITHFHLAPKLKRISPMRLNGAMLNLISMRENFTVTLSTQPKAQKSSLTYPIL